MRKGRKSKRKRLIKTTNIYHIDNEQEATETVENFKSRQLSEGFMVLKTKIDYKPKKDRKTGEIIDEKWITEITIGYEI